MARKLAAQLGVETTEEIPVEPEPQPVPQAGRAPAAPRRTRAKSAENPGGWRRKTGRVLFVAGIVLAAMAAAAVAYQVDEFLAKDPHFLLPSENLAIGGVTYTPRAEVERVFARDIGRSVYLIPLAERRNRLLTIDWVEDASIARHWPNRIVVRITERKPIAFVVLPAASAWAASEVALVDREGVILKPPERAKFSLPALAGISKSDPAATRRSRVEQAAAMIGEVQNYAGQISEIDVSDPENLTVTLAQDRALRLRLGNRNYLTRLSNFLSHYPDISRRLPRARTFDLRLDDHITAQDGGPDER